MNETLAIVCVVILLFTALYQQAKHEWWKKEYIELSLKSAELRAKVARMDEAFSDMVKLSYDYNGYQEAENLKELIDILRKIAENREPLP
jgi:hypothetical protein